MERCRSGELLSLQHFRMSDGLNRWGSGSNSLDFIVPPIEALTSFVGASATITQSLSNDLHPGVNAARGTDVAFVFVNALVSHSTGLY